VDKGNFMVREELRFISGMRFLSLELKALHFLVERVQVFGLQRRIMFLFLLLQSTVVGILFTLAAFSAVANLS
jgi:hypothetical protein